jgi:hypothetical protein
MPNDLPHAPQRPAILIDGASHPALDAGLIELRLEDSLAGPSSCRATFQNWGTRGGGEVGFLHFDRSVLDIGKPLRVVGPAGLGTVTLFDGVVNVLEGEFPREQAPQISCVALPRLHAFRTAVRNRSFPNQTDARVFSQIAAEHGLTARLSLGSAPVRVPDQKKVSDLAFVLGRARAIGAEAWLDGDDLHVHSASLRPMATDSLVFGSNLLELRGTWGAAMTGRLTRGTSPAVVVAGMALATIRLQAGLRLRLKGVGALFEGEYYLTSTSHRFSGVDGFTCSFEAERVAD